MESLLTPGHWQTIQSIAESLDSLDLDRTLFTIRNALVEQAGFDRAGILLLDENDPNYLVGTWGTAPDGAPQSEHDWRTLVEEHPNSSRVLRGEAPYILRHSEVPHIPSSQKISKDLPQHAIVPLKYRDQMLGVMSVDNLFTQRPITEKHVQFLLLVARHVAVAIDKARLYERERRQSRENTEAAQRYVRRLEGLQLAAAKVASAHSLTEALNGILNAAVEVMTFDRQAIWQLDEGGPWRCAAYQGLSEAYRTGTEEISRRSPNGFSVLLDKLRSGNPLVIRDVRQAPEWEARRQLALDEGIGCLITYPLLVTGELLGTLVFYGDVPNCFTDEDITLGKLFAHHAAMAIHKARAYDALREARDDLAERVEERTRELSEAQGQLVRSERLAAIGQVSATIAHDLRGPLGVINNAAYLLSMRLKDADEKVVQSIQTLKNQVQACSTIITDLLDFSRDVQPKRKPVPWKKIIGSALNTLPPEPRVQVKPELEEESAPVSMDPDLMERAVANLIHNAVQILEEREEGVVRITSCRDSEGDWLRISDNGPGVPEDLRERIFEPFFTTRRRGTGLGLPLVKRIVEAHGGTVSVEAAEEGGACFAIRLPL